PLQPSAEGGRHMQPVAMLEGEDQAAARLVVAHDRTRAVERRLLARTSAAERRAPRLELEGQSAAGAARCAEEGNPAPARSAEGSGFAHRRAAGKAARGQE